MCFLASEPDRCTVILPFRDVVKAEPMDPGDGSRADDSFADVNGVFITTRSAKAEENSLIMGGIAKPHTLCGIIHSHRDVAMQSPPPPETPNPPNDSGDAAEMDDPKLALPDDDVKAANPDETKSGKSPAPQGDIELEPLLVTCPVFRHVRVVSLRDLVLPLLLTGTSDSGSSVELRSRPNKKQIDRPLRRRQLR